MRIAKRVHRTPRLLRHSPFSTARRCRKRSSLARRSSGTPRWRCSIATVSTASRGFISQPRGRAAADRRGGADGRGRPRPARVALARTSPPSAGLRAPALRASAPRRLAPGLSQPVPAHHADEAARAERRGRAHARRSRWPRRRAGGARRAGSDQRPPLRRRRPRRSTRGRVRRRRASRSSCSGTCCRDEESDNHALSISRRRSTCRSSPPTACASRSRPIGRSTTSSPASVTRPRSRMPGGG